MFAEQRECATKEREREGEQEYFNNLNGRKCSDEDVTCNKDSESMTEKCELKAVVLVERTSGCSVNIRKFISFFIKKRINVRPFY